MIASDAPFLTTILALAASFLGLAIIVQVIQELYKYLAGTKAVAYRKSLEDALGPWAAAVSRPGALPDLRVRGALQFRRLRPRGLVIPLQREQLVPALERTAPVLVQQGIDCLAREVQFQAGLPQAASPSWRAYLREIGDAERGSRSYWTALEICEFLASWHHVWKRPRERGKDQPERAGQLTPPGNLNASQLQEAFRSRFTPEVDRAAAALPQVNENFEYQYRRRNTRLTATIAFLLALLCNLPFDELYRKARETDPATAVAMAEKVLELYHARQELGAGQDSVVLRNLEIAGNVAAETLKAERSKMYVDYLISWPFVQNLFRQGWLEILKYLLGCAVTAVFVAFGAPLWNDVASALLRLQKGSPKAGGTLKESGNG